MKTEKQPLLGLHVSAAGGLSKSVENAVLLGAQTFQIHATSPRQWAVKLPKDEEVQKYLTALGNSQVKTVFIHAPYLINLASPDEVIYRKSMDNLIGNLKIAELIKATGVIFHLGSAMGADRETSKRRQIAALKEIVKQTKGSAKIILENSAGGGNKFGHQLNDLAEIIDGVGSDRLAVCFDTAHAFEAGIIKEYTKTTIHALLNEVDKLIGLEKLVAMHINDSKTAFGSNHDRHENLGDGQIGLTAFKLLAKEKRLNGTSWILEVPGEGEGPTRKQLDLLKSLFKK